MESGKDIALAAIGEANDTYVTFFDMGMVKCIVYDCEEAVFGVYIPMLVNAIMGYDDVARVDGKGLIVPVTRWTITDAAEIDAIYAFHDAGNWFVSAEDMAAGFKGLNPDVTTDTYEEIFNITKITPWFLERIQLLLKHIDLFLLCHGFPPLFYFMNEFMNIL